MRPPTSTLPLGPLLVVSKRRVNTVLRRITLSLSLSLSHSLSFYFFSSFFLFRYRADSFPSALPTVLASAIFVRGGGSGRKIVAGLGLGAGLGSAWAKTSMEVEKLWK